MKKSVSTTSQSSALDSYIEKKRAMEERARLIKQERSSNKDEVESAAASRASQLQRLRNPIIVDDPFSDPPSSNNNYNSNNNYSSANNNYNVATSNPPAMSNSASRPNISRPSRLQSATTTGDVSMSRAEYDNMVDRMQHLENEVGVMRDKHTRLLDDFEGTNAELQSLRQEVKNIQKLLKNTTLPTKTAIAPQPSQSYAQQQQFAQQPPQQYSQQQPTYSQQRSTISPPQQQSHSPYSQNNSYSSQMQQVQSSANSYSQPAQYSQNSYGSQSSNYDPYNQQPIVDKYQSATTSNKMNSTNAALLRSAMEPRQVTSILKQPSYTEQPSYAKQESNSSYSKPNNSGYAQKYNQNEQDDDEEEENAEDEENPEEEQEREECELCGRKFVPESLEKHRKICKKVFQSKRKPMEIQRVPDEALKIEKENKKKGTKKPVGAGAAIAATQQKSTIPKWQLQRMQLQEAVRAGREVSEAIKTGAPLPPPVQSMAADDRVACPHCSRKFAVDVADRHIPKCESMKHNKPRR